MMGLEIPTFTLNHLDRDRMRTASQTLDRRKIERNTARLGGLPPDNIPECYETLRIQR